MVIINLFKCSIELLNYIRIIFSVKLTAWHSRKFSLQEIRLIQDICRNIPLFEHLQAAKCKFDGYKRRCYYLISITKCDNMLRDFFLGFIKIHILHHAEQEAVYGLALIQELARHGYTLSPGTLYPVLHSLEQAGYLVSEERVVKGKVRKYYTITAAGSQALVEARERIRELVDEVLEGEGPTQLPDPPDSSE